MAGAGADLIKRMAAGDRDAFSQVYDRYAPLAYALIVRIVRERADAAEVLQDVFWEAWQSAASYDPARGSPEAWISMRARARAIDRVRSLRRRGETFVASLDENLAPPVDHASQDRSAQRVADRGAIVTGLAQLPEAQREVIELAYYAGMTQSEIAERTGQPLGTVKTRIRLGLERLRELLAHAV
jgi:RNA polymerase sigma-70 factor (ECF subfamily)